jgi:hypothetical protein
MSAGARPRHEVEINFAAKAPSPSPPSGKAATVATSTLGPAPSLSPIVNFAAAGPRQASLARRRTPPEAGVARQTAAAVVARAAVPQFADDP